MEKEHTENSRKNHILHPEKGSRAEDVAGVFLATEAGKCTNFLFFLFFLFFFFLTLSERGRVGARHQPALVTHISVDPQPLWSGVKGETSASVKAGDG